MDGTPTITVHRVRAALGGARRLGLDVVPLLQTARIPPLLLRDDAARVTPEQFARLVRALHRATRDEFLGLGRVPSRPGTFAMMGYACVGCRDLGTALARAVRFYGLFPGGPDLALEERHGEAVLLLRNDLRGLAEGWFLAESALMIWHRLASWLIGRRIPLHWARFGHPAPPYAAEYGPMFGCPVRFGAAAPAGTGFDARWLAAPVVRDEAGLEELLRRVPAELIGRRDYGPATVTEQVRGSFAVALRA
ncbi:AraC family transcriptional regulator, partial [Streptomyces sp. NPDC049577]|uniref:AraC family transcriptional regulator n=1 Tax=Streptomyces sp. NPDC049577 TaxID=3155153 RepID=UPI00344103CD